MKYIIKIGKKFKIVILDFVKTLVAEQVNWDKLREINCLIFKKYGIDIEPQYLRPIIEQTASQLRFLQHLKFAPGKISKIEKELILAQRKFERESIELFSLYPDVIPFITYANKKNLKTGILTNNSLFTVKEIFSRFKVPFCGKIIGREDIRNPKPNPEGVRKLLKNLNANPAESVLIGDSDFDMDAAKQAGIYAVFLKRNDNVKLRYTKADQQIYSLSEIFEVI